MIEGNGDTAHTAMMPFKRTLPFLDLLLDLKDCLSIRLIQS